MWTRSRRSMIMQPRSTSRVAFWASVSIFIAAIAAAATAYLARPQIIITEGLSDTLFLLNLGYFFTEGFVPNVDYPHFYGGLTSVLNGAWLSMLDGAPTALDLTMLTFLAICAVLLMASLPTRGGGLAGLCLSLLLCALMLTRTAFERGEFDLLAHSHFMMYNRAAWGFSALLLYCGVLQVCAQEKRHEILRAVVFGLCIFFIAWTKASFGIVVAIACLTLLALRELRFVAIGVVTFAALLLAVSATSLFGVREFYESTAFFLFQASLERSSSFGITRKMAWTGLATLMPLLLLGAWLAAQGRGAIGRRALVFCAASALAMFFATIGTGSFKIESVLGPLGAILAILLIAASDKAGLRPPDLRRFAVPVIVTLAFSGGHLLSGLSYMVKNTAGQQSRYTNSDAIGVVFDPQRAPYQSIDQVRHTVDAANHDPALIIDRSDALLMASIQDAVDIAAEIDILPSDEVVSLTTLYLPYFLKTRPAVHFPSYGRGAWHAHEGFNIPDAVDYVFVPRFQSPSWNDGYTPDLERHFSIVAMSPFWTVHRRRSAT